MIGKFPENNTTMTFFLKFMEMLSKVKSKVTEPRMFIKLASTCVSWVNFVRRLEHWIEEWGKSNMEGCMEWTLLVEKKYDSGVCLHRLDSLWYTIPVILTIVFKVLFPVYHDHIISQKIVNLKFTCTPLVTWDSAGLIALVLICWLQTPVVFCCIDIQECEQFLSNYCCWYNSILFY